MHVVITGGTRGIGFGIAREFLRGGHWVTVCGRDIEGTERAIGALGAEHGAGRVQGLPCDVGRVLGARLHRVPVHDRAPHRQPCRRRP